MKLATFEPDERMSAPPCPDNADLERFAVGDLDGPACDRLAEHVLACPRCDALLQSFDHRCDPLDAGLRSVPDANGELAPPTEFLRSVSGEVSLDCGRRY